jgi:hypothetical protein
LRLFSPINSFQFGQPSVLAFKVQGSKFKVGTPETLNFEPGLPWQAG